MIYVPENTAEAGRPKRVFVNGDHIDNAVYVDTDIGLVQFYPKPLRISDHDGGSIRIKEIRGSVEVKDL